MIRSASHSPPRNRVKLSGLDYTREAEEIFSEAVGLNPADREDYLVRVCGTRSTLRRELEGLLSADQKNEGFLDPPGPKEVTKRLGVRPILRVGSSSRGVHVLHPLSAGGTSTVYLGVLVGTRERVAIKVLHPWANCGAPEESLQTERQALSRLTNPAVIGWIGEGTTATGCPYLMLEFFRGLPIDEYCRVCGLDLQSRLQLVSRICNALDDVHRRGIVHCDLKPSHLLIGKNERIRIIDFGIARILGREKETGEGEPRHSFRACTPTFASPEQLRGEPPGFASDLYSMGLVLRELVEAFLPGRADLQALLSDVLHSSPAKRAIPMEQIASVLRGIAK